MHYELECKMRASKCSQNEQRKMTSDDQEEGGLCVSGVINLSFEKFGEADLKWKFVEKATQMTKRSKLHTLKCVSTNGSIIIARKGDLMLCNKNKLEVCVSELRDGSFSSLPSVQELESSRCTKALKAFSSMFNGSEPAWSLGWNDKRLITLTEASELDESAETIVILFKLKNDLFECNNQFTAELQEEEKIEARQFYNSPKKRCNESNILESFVRQAYSELQYYPAIAKLGMDAELLIVARIPSSLITA
ncbi:hypothetical protein EDC96DRAFT_584068 [Choanephora cucurbitarum]|nr:hypothetical protein EDC96DRAFT_584068 [Choanephora cucurbitarum]